MERTGGETKAKKAKNSDLCDGRKGDWPKKKKAKKAKKKRSNRNEKQEYPDTNDQFPSMPQQRVTGRLGMWQDFGKTPSCLALRPRVSIHVWLCFLHFCVYALMCLSVNAHVRVCVCVCVCVCMPMRICICVSDCAFGVFC